jgi:hypothetical protein
MRGEVRLSEAWRSDGDSQDFAAGWTTKATGRGAGENSGEGQGTDITAGPTAAHLMVPRLSAGIQDLGWHSVVVLSLFLAWSNKELEVELHVTDSDERT